MSSTRASPMTRSLCWQESSEPCTSSTRRGGDHLGATSSAMTSPTSSPTTPRGRSLIPPTSMTTSSRTTITRATIRRRPLQGQQQQKFQKIMSQACATLSNFDFSSDNSSSSEVDEKVKCKPCNFTGLCLIGKSSRNISDSDVSDNLSPESPSL
jgi:hypothetical protein